MEEIKDILLGMQNSIIELIKGQAKMQQDIVEIKQEQQVMKQSIAKLENELGKTNKTQDRILDEIVLIERRQDASEKKSDDHGKLISRLSSNVFENTAQ